jgi:hypothetical protein
MTDIEAATATIGMLWKVKEILRDALGGDFAVTNSGIGPRESAWFVGFAGPELVLRVQVVPHPVHLATPEDEARIEGLEAGRLTAHTATSSRRSE